MATIVRIIAWSGLVGLALAGCGPRFAWEGEWEGFRPYAAKPGEDPSVARTAATVRLTVNADGTYDLTDAGIPASGEFRSSGLEARLEPTRVAGVPIDRVGEQFKGRAKLLARGADIDYFGGLDSTDPVVLKRRAGRLP